MLSSAPARTARTARTTTRKPPPPLPSSSATPQWQLGAQLWLNMAPAGQRATPQSTKVPACARPRTQQGRGVATPSGVVVAPGGVGVGVGVGVGGGVGGGGSGAKVAGRPMVKAFV